MRADEELEARAAKKLTARSVYEDETKKRTVALNADIDTGARHGFGICSSSVSGDALHDSVMK